MKYHTQGTQVFLTRRINTRSPNQSFSTPVYLSAHIIITADSRNLSTDDANITPRAVSSNAAEICRQGRRQNIRLLDMFRWRVHLVDKNKSKKGLFVILFR